MFLIRVFQNERFNLLRFFASLVNNKLVVLVMVTGLSGVQFGL